ncbi:MAG TPA: hypothetical protein VN736_01065 [Candidatus Limnocylindrales bacterium]|nr:hypothetical protein [Candidatus Limnocylindrales bacterium]
MRKALEQMYGQRKRFFGVFERCGRKPAYRGWGSAGNGNDETVLLRDIRDESGRMVTDHLWFRLTVKFGELFLVPGEVISFDARVDGYTKGYGRDDYDYKLSRPTKVVEHGRPDWADYDGPPAYREILTRPEFRVDEEENVGTS